MIKHLQRQFIALAMLSLFIVLLLVLTVVNVINISNLNQRADSIIDVLADNQGKFPTDLHDPQSKDTKMDDRNISAETPFETRFFVVWADSSNEISSIDTGHIAAVTSDAAEGYAQDVLAGTADRGYKDNYRFRIVSQADGTSLIIFVDARNTLSTAESFLINSVLVAAVSLVVLLIIVSLLSSRAVKPFVENVERQKRFITDAAHELRTPLAIISADNDVIEMTTEKSEWTGSINSQIRRMDSLINDLILMSRMEETQDTPGISKVNLSRIAEEKVQDRLVIVEQKQVKVEKDLQTDVTCMGDEKNLGRVIEILLDNAVKYVSDGGVISLSCTSEGKKVRFSIENTCGELPQGDLRRLFDRFYRADEARTHQTGSKGGYGIGLSMADAIIRRQHGKIRAERVQPDRIRFCFELPA